MSVPFEAWAPKKIILQQRILKKSADWCPEWTNSTRKSSDLDLSMAASMPMANQFPSRISTHIWPNLQMLLKMDKPRRISPIIWYKISSLLVNKKYEWYKCRWYRWLISWHSCLYHSFKDIHLSVCQLMLINGMCVTWRTITVRILKGLDHPKLTKSPILYCEICLQLIPNTVINVRFEGTICKGVWFYIRW